MWWTRPLDNERSNTATATDTARKGGSFLNESNERWQRKDALMGLLFFSVGALAIIYAVLAMRNDMPGFLWGAAWIFGPICLLIGGNAIIRSLRAK